MGIKFNLRQPLLILLVVLFFLSTSTSVAAVEDDPLEHAFASTLQSRKHGPILWWISDSSNSLPQPLPVPYNWSGFLPPVAKYLPPHFGGDLPPWLESNDISSSIPQAPTPSIVIDCPCLLHDNSVESLKDYRLPCYEP